MYTMSNIKNLSLKIVSAEKNTITADQSTAFQKYPYVKIVFINNGEGLLTFKDTSEKVGPNQIVLLNPNIVTLGISKLKSSGISNILSNLLIFTLPLKFI